MALDRNAIIDALVTRLTGVPGVKTVRRHARREVGFNDQPAILVLPGDQTAQPDPGHPTLWRLSVGLRLYVHDASDAGPSRLLHTLIDRIEAALEPTPQEAVRSTTTTLGGLVASCHFAGPIQIDDALDDWGGAEIPVEIVAAS